MQLQEDDWQGASKEGGQIFSPPPILWLKYQSGCVLSKKAILPRTSEGMHASSHESTKGWPLGEANVYVSTKGVQHDGQHTAKTRRKIVSYQHACVRKQRDDLLSADWPREKNVYENVLIEQVLKRFRNLCYGTQLCHSVTIALTETELHELQGGIGDAESVLFHSLEKKNKICTIHISQMSSQVGVSWSVQKIELHTTQYARNIVLWVTYIYIYIKAPIPPVIQVLTRRYSYAAESLTYLRIVPCFLAMRHRARNTKCFRRSIHTYMHIYIQDQYKVGDREYIHHHVHVHVRNPLEDIRFELWGGFD